MAKITLTEDDGTVRDFTEAVAETPAPTSEVEATPATPEEAPAEIAEAAA